MALSTKTLDSSSINTYKESKLDQNNQTSLEGKKLSSNAREIKRVLNALLTPEHSVHKNQFTPPDAKFQYHNNSRIPCLSEEEMLNPRRTPEEKYNFFDTVVLRINCPKDKSKRNQTESERAEIIAEIKLELGGMEVYKNPSFGGGARGHIKPGYQYYRFPTANCNLRRVFSVIGRIEAGEFNTEDYKAEVVRVDLTENRYNAVKTYSNNPIDSYSKQEQLKLDLSFEYKGSIVQRLKYKENSQYVGYGCHTFIINEHGRSYEIKIYCKPRFHGEGGDVAENIGHHLAFFLESREQNIYNAFHDPKVWEEYGISRIESRFYYIDPLEDQGLEYPTPKWLGNLTQMVETHSYWADILHKAFTVAYPLRDSMASYFNCKAPSTLILVEDSEGRMAEWAYLLWYNSVTGRGTGFNSKGSLFKDREKDLLLVPIGSYEYIEALGYKVHPHIANILRYNSTSAPINVYRLLLPRNKKEGFVVKDFQVLQSNARVRPWLLPCTAFNAKENTRNVHKDNNAKEFPYDCLPFNTLTTRPFSRPLLSASPTTVAAQKEASLLATQETARDIRDRLFPGTKLPSSKAMYNLSTLTKKKSGMYCLFHKGDGSNWILGCLTSIIDKNSRKKNPKLQWLKIPKSRFKGITTDIAVQLPYIFKLEHRRGDSLVTVEPIIKQNIA
ncbi:MAG: hypothetical protein AAF383_06535 [Cyanobacteria bacterium P01_A01_bin.83]